MAKVRWTDEQQCAISAPVGNLLVSASAGSGKTAVLVERIINRITGENHTDINKLLVVTFTKAAAAEMKQRLSARLGEMLRDEPDNINLKRQMMLLESADIGTMDSFFSNLVKEHFHELEQYGITLDYKVIQNEDLAVLSEEVIGDLLESKYALGKDSFYRFIDYFTDDRSDSDIKDFVEQVHAYISSMYEWRYWVMRLPMLYDEGKTQELKSVILQSIKPDLSYLTSLYGDMLALCKDIEDFKTKLYPAIFEEFEQVEKVARLTDLGDYNGVQNAVGNFCFGSLSRTKADYNSQKEYIKCAHNICKDMVLKKIAGKLCVTDEDIEIDNALLYPVMKEFSDFIAEYEDELLKRKVKLGAFEFSDISRFAMSLFIDGQGNETPFCAEIRDMYDEIYIDECQDTNELQNTFFDKISRGGKNLFLVGDAKQSIYRFRNAAPEIFIDRLEHLPSYGSDFDGGYILLKTNFRSSVGVVDFINCIFNRVMSKSAGDIEYDDKQRLTAPQSNTKGNLIPAQVHFVKNPPQKCGEKAAQFEQRYLAKLIKDMVESGEPVYDEKSGTLRPVRYDDFCVLMRSTTKLSGYIKAFEELNIPTYSSASAGFYKQKEIRFAIDFMKAVDNPLKSTELLAVMYSGIFGFTADDLARVKVSVKSAPLYTMVSQCARQGNAKCVEFCDKFNKIRGYSTSLTPSRFLERLYFELGYYALAGAQPNGAQRQANLTMLLDVVESFESNGHTSISSVIRYIDKVARNSDKTKCAYFPAMNEKVSFMTIHASKGLQFPIVVLAQCSAPFKNENSAMVMNKLYGIGVKYKDTVYGYKNVTLPYNALKIHNGKANISEELRLLYVALTRAQQRLILLGSISKNSVINSALHYSVEENKCFLSGVLNSSSYTDLLLRVLVHHPLAQVLRDEVPFDVPVFNSSSKLSVHIEQWSEKEEFTKETPAPVYDDRLLESIKSRFSYKYEYSDIFGIGAMATASGLNSDKIQISDWQFEKPSFIGANTLAGADRGVAIHRFMECADLKKIGTDIDGQLNSLVSKGQLTHEQARAVDRSKISRFCSSPLYKTILESDEYLREYRFSFLMNAGEVYGDLPDIVSGEKVFVQGVTDGVIIKGDSALIVDYKTDRVKTPEELANRYREQMKIYCRAVSDVLGKKVTGCSLYSFHLGDVVKVF